MQKRGYLKFLVVSIPFYTADVFAEEENVKVNSFGSESFEIGTFGKITPLSLEPYINNEENNEYNLLNILPFALAGVIAGSLVLFTSSAVFVLTLLMMIPIVSKRAEATGIIGFKVSGYDNEIDGFAGGTEGLKFVLEQVLVDGDSDINSSQLRLYEGVNSIATNFNCIRIRPDTDGFICGSDSVDNNYCPTRRFILQLYDDNDTFVATEKSNNLTCDVNEPVVNSLSSDKADYGSNEMVNLSYSFTDSACYGPGCADENLVIGLF